MSQQPPTGPTGPSQPEHAGPHGAPGPDQPESSQSVDGQQYEYAADPPDPWADNPQVPDPGDDNSWPPADQPAPPEGHLTADTPYVGAAPTDGATEGTSPAGEPGEYDDQVEYEVEPYPPSWPPPSPYTQSGDSADSADSDEYAAPAAAEPAASAADSPSNGPDDRVDDNPTDATPTDATPTDATPAGAASSDTATADGGHGGASDAPSDSESTHLAMAPYPGPPPAGERAMPSGSSPYAPRDLPAEAATSAPAGASPYAPRDAASMSGPGAAEPHPEYEITYAAPGAVPTGGGSSAVSRPNPPKSKRGLAWTALAVVAALIAGAAVWFFLTRGNDSDNQAGGGDSSTTQQSDDRGSSGSEGGESSGSESGSEGSSGGVTDADGKLTQDAQLKVSALYDGYTKAWEDASATGDFAPVAKYAVDNAHPDFKPDQAQCVAAYQAAGAKKGYREKTTVDFATVAPAPDWTPPGASEKPKGEVFKATAQQYAGVGLAAKPQPVEVYFAFVDDKAYMFPDCG